MVKLTLVAVLFLAACNGGEKAPLQKDTLPDGEAGPQFDTLQVDSGVSALPSNRVAPMMLAARAAAVENQHPDSSVYSIYYALDRPLRPADTVRVRFWRDSTAGVPAIPGIERTRFGQRDTASFRVAKVFGTEAKYGVSVRVRTQGVNLSTMGRNFATNWPAKVDTTPPKVDTVRVDSALAIARIDAKPDKVELSFGQQQQFCAFVVFQDGQVALRDKERTTPPCPQEYLKFASNKRNPSPGQQLVADLLCVKWEATGGSIQAEVCESNVRTVPS